MPLTEKEKQSIRAAAERVYEASKLTRILTHLAWPQQVREEFFRRGARELPVVDYPPIDARAVVDQLEAVRGNLQVPSPYSEWLLNTVDQIETSAMMLHHCGDPGFTDLSIQLYGAPASSLTDEENTALDLAIQFDGLFGEFDGLDLGLPEETTATADQVAARMRESVVQMFGSQAPEVTIVDELSANALAGPQSIRIRRGAEFTDRDVEQLIHHEAGIHVGTSLNGMNQDHLPILAAAHAGTTTTQEGLAVFAELITGSLDLDRFRRLADRVIAIQMALEGADFLEVYRWFLNRTDSEEQSFENARRVFRGGVLTGGAPFTKDIVYLDGLLRIHNFLRTMVGEGRADCLRLLFCGKLAIEDLPVLAELTREGLCRPPQFLPYWARDVRFLLCYLAYSLFLNRIDLSAVRQRYRSMLHAMPPLN